MKNEYILRTFLLRLCRARGDLAQLAGLGFLIVASLVHNSMAAPLSNLSWHQLPPLPDPNGFASPVVGVTKDVLLLAGGANFPGKQLWEGGTKKWHDRIFALTPGATEWQPAGKLPAPLAYAVSVSTPDGVLCAGGGDAQKHSAAVFLMQWQNGTIGFQNLPSLPKPVAMGTGALVGTVVYFAGGLESPDSKQALTTFFALDLKNTAAGWKTLPSWPGPGRSQAVAATVGGHFYLFSGVRYEPKTGGGFDMVYLADAYRYSSTNGWVRLPDLPHPALAAASPAPALGDMLFLIGGADGASVGSPPQDFKMVPQRIQAYSARNNSWSEAGNAPVGRVCVSTAEWHGEWIIPSGERSAGVRSPEVWSARITLADSNQ